MIVEGRGKPKDPDAIEEVSLATIAAILAAIVLTRGRIITTTGSVIRGIPKPKPELPKDILNPGGKPLGRPGKSPEIRVQNGGDKAARDLYDQLSKGGTPESPPNYPGFGTRLPNGDWVGYRPTSRSGTPTIDLDIDGIDFNKIHFSD